MAQDGVRGIVFYSSLSLTHRKEIKMKSLTFLASALAAAPLLAAVPVIDTSSVSVQQGPGKTVIIDYTMNPATSGDTEPAIVTVDILTNAVGGVATSVGGEHLTTLSGDVNKVVPHTANYKHKILWEPTKEGFPEFKLPAEQVTAKITLWSTNAPPNYWIIDLTKPADRMADRYYPEAGQIPLGVTNVLYKTDRLVMRRIPAKGVTWRQGGSEGTLGFTVYRYVTFSYDYYMSIYELTYTQYDRLRPSTWASASGVTPYLQNLQNIRNNAVDSDWPAKGHDFSDNTGFMRSPRSKTGLKFDLPTAAEWEFACRAGSSTKYCNGDTEADLAKVAWYYGNSGGEIHEVGTKEPNEWGLYDMHGNAWEYTLTRHAYVNNTPAWDPVGPTAAETSGKTSSEVNYTNWQGSWRLMGGIATDSTYGTAGACASYYDRDAKSGTYKTSACRLCLPLP